MVLEWVAKCLWNGWPNVYGISGRMGLEYSASATLAGIEAAHMIRKGQFINNLLPAHQQFMALAA